MKNIRCHPLKDCLKDADISIRKRALDVTYSLVDETNIKSGSQGLVEGRTHENIAMENHHY